MDGEDSTSNVNPMNKMNTPLVTTWGTHYEYFQWAGKNTFWRRASFVSPTLSTQLRGKRRPPQSPARFKTVVGVSGAKASSSSSQDARNPWLCGVFRSHQGLLGEFPSWATFLFRWWCKCRITRTQVEIKNVSVQYSHPRYWWLPAEWSQPYSSQLSESTGILPRAAVMLQLSW